MAGRRTSPLVAARAIRSHLDNCGQRERASRRQIRLILCPARLVVCNNPER
jgi:hypothetical protein